MKWACLEGSGFSGEEVGNRRRKRRIREDCPPSAPQLHAAALRQQAERHAGKEQPPHELPGTARNPNAEFPLDANGRLVQSRRTRSAAHRKSRESCLGKPAATWSVIRPSACVLEHLKRAKIVQLWCICYDTRHQASTIDYLALTVPRVKSSSAKDNCSFVRQSRLPHSIAYSPQKRSFIATCPMRGSAAFCTFPKLGSLTLASTESLG